MTGATAKIINANSVLSSAVASGSSRALVPIRRLSAQLNSVHEIQMHPGCYCFYRGAVGVFSVFSVAAAHHADVCPPPVCDARAGRAAGHSIVMQTMTVDLPNASDVLTALKTRR